MKFRKYLVTNHGKGSITIMGTRRVEIPAKCEEHLIALPDTTAKATVNRLKQQYPLLRFADYKESKNAEKTAVTDTETTAAVIEHGANTEEAETAESVENTENGSMDNGEQPASE